MASQPWNSLLDWRPVAADEASVVARAATPATTADQAVGPRTGSNVSAAAAATQRFRAGGHARACFRCEAAMSAAPAEEDEKADRVDHLFSAPAGNPTGWPVSEPAGSVSRRGSAGVDECRPRPPAGAAHADTVYIGGGGRGGARLGARVEMWMEGRGGGDVGGD